LSEFGKLVKGSSADLSGDQQPTGIVSLPGLIGLCLLFFLIKKSNKKIKAKRIAPLVLP